MAGRLHLARLSIFAILTEGAAGIIHALARGQENFPISVVAGLIAWTWLLFFMVVLLFVAAVLVRGHCWEKTKSGE